MDQDPGPDEVVEAGTEVDLVVSAGSETVTVPDILGQSERDATATLTDLGLNVDVVEQDSDEPQGIVVDSDPRPATEVEAGSTVTIFVSTGPAEVPNVVGMTEDEAVSTLEDEGFEVDVRRDTTTPSEQGHRAEPGPARRERGAAGVDGDDHGLRLRGAERVADAHPHADGDPDRDPDQ